jgi:hypothetical protein
VQLRDVPEPLAFTVLLPAVRRSSYLDFTLHAALSSLKKISCRVFFNPACAGTEDNEALISIAITVTLAEA